MSGDDNSPEPAGESLSDSGSSVEAPATPPLTRSYSPRDNGRFAPRENGHSAAPRSSPEAASSRESEVVAGLPQYQPQAGPEAPRPDVPQQDDGPPQSWAKDYREHWNAIPAELRPYIHQREAEAHSRITELGQSSKLAGEIGETFSRYGVELPAGVSQSRAVEALLAADHLVRTNPQQALQYLARTAGVDLRQLAGGGDPVDHHAISERASQMENAARHFASEAQSLRSELARLRADQTADAERRKVDGEKAAKEAKRQARINHHGSGVGSTPVRTTLDETIRRTVNRVYGG